jgi:hypothetical protein
MSMVAVIEHERYCIEIVTFHVVATWVLIFEAAQRAISPNKK